MLQNAVRAALLDSEVYKEFRERAELVLHSVGTVSATGVTLAVALRYTSPSTGGGFQNLQMVMVAFSTVLVGWMIWSFVAKALCNLWGSEAQFRDTMRATGISYGPGILILLTTIPKVGPVVLFIVWVWILISVTRAIEVTHGVSLLKAAVPGFIGWFLAWILLPVLMLGSFFFSSTDLGS